MELRVYSEKEISHYVQSFTQSNTFMADSNINKNPMRCFGDNAPENISKRGYFRGVNAANPSVITF